MVESKPITTKIGGLALTSCVSQSPSSEIVFNTNNIRQASAVYDFNVGSSDSDAIKISMNGLGSFKVNLNVDVLKGIVTVYDVASGPFSTSILGHKGSFDGIPNALSGKTPEPKEKFQGQDAYRLRLAANGNRNQAYKLSLDETWSICVAGMSVTLESDGKGNLAIKKYGLDLPNCLAGSLYFTPPPSPAMPHYTRRISEAQLLASQMQAEKNLVNSVL